MTSKNRRPQIAENYYLKDIIFTKDRPILPAIIFT
jgi:hypothetical protein